MNKVVSIFTLLLLDGVTSFTFHTAPLVRLPVSGSVSKANKSLGLNAEKSKSDTSSDSSRQGSPVALKSGKKEVSYDEVSGRLLDSGDDKGCMPDEEFCIVDKGSGKLVRLTLEEKERIFLDALQSYYVSGRELLNDSEFDLLKEDLAWNGSPVAVLNRKEAKYLASMQAYLKGEPIISDEEFDALKIELKEEKSPFAVSKEPKCYIDTGICTVTFQEDSFRSNLLYLPVGASLFIIWLGLGFELIEPIIRINPILLLLLGGPFIFYGSKIITEQYIFTDKKIAYGPCPICEAETRTYFGNILGVEGFQDIADVKCTKCKKKFKVQRDTLRASTLPKK